MNRSPLTRRAFGALSALSAAAVCVPAVLQAAQADGPALGPLTIAVGGQGVLYHLPLALADQLGYFRAEGLDVQVRDYSAGALALQAVQEGTADVCAGAFEHTIRQQVRGQAYRSLVLLGRGGGIRGHQVHEARRNGGNLRVDGFECGLELLGAKGAEGVAARNRGQVQGHVDGLGR